MKNGERPRYIMPAANGHQAIVEILINSIADNEWKKSFLSIQDHTYHDDHSLCRKDEGMTALHCASENGHQIVVKTMTDSFADDEEKTTFLSIKNVSGETALHLAAGNGHQIVVETMLKSFADDKGKFIFLSTKDYKDRGTTALHYAAANGHQAIVEFLLSSFADNGRKFSLLSVQGLHPTDGAFVRSNNRCTALHLAARQGHKKTVETLIGVLQDEESRRNFLYIPTSEDEDERVEQAAERASFRVGRGRIYESYWDHDIFKPPVSNPTGQTALHLALMNGHISVVKTLLTSVRTVDYLRIQDHSRMNLLHCALSSRHGNQALVETIIGLVPEEDRQFFICSQNDLGRSALHYAAEQGQETVVDLFVKAFVDGEERRAFLSIQDITKKQTALHFAALRGHQRIVDNLINCLPSERRIEFVSIKDKNGHTALMIAANNIQEGLLRAYVNNISRVEFVSIEGKNGQAVRRIAADNIQEDISRDDHRDACRTTGTPITNIYDAAATTALYATASATASATTTIAAITAATTAASRDDTAATTALYATAIATTTTAGTTAAITAASRDDECDEDEDDIYA